MATVTVLIDGDPVPANVGQTVAEALLARGLSTRRHVKGGWRALYCMMGVCFECLVTIDGVQNRQACMVSVAEGMQIQRQVKHG